MHSRGAEMAIFGSISALQTQLGERPHLPALFQYLEDLLHPRGAAHERLIQMRDGDVARIELASGAFAMEQAYQTKASSSVRWESHRAYIDIQVVVVGEEYMEVADVSRLRVAEDLSSEKDVLFYFPSERESMLKVSGGAGGVFFPVDAHRPSLAVDAPVSVRKTVIKVPVVWWGAHG